MGDRQPFFDQVLIAYTIYARLLDAQSIRIIKPINDEVRSYYEKFETDILNLPIPGEVSLEDVRRMALHFATVEKWRMRVVGEAPSAASESY